MVKKNNFLLILQARQNSTRFPNKVLQKIHGIPLIIFLLKKLNKCKKVDQVVTVIPKNKKNKDLKKILQKYNFQYFEGSEKNVLERFYLCAKKFNKKNIIRITADCPLSDPQIIDKFTQIFKNKNVDYLSNGNPPTFPDGFDVEIFTFNALEKSYFSAKSLYEKEHVTPYIKKNIFFSKYNVINKIDLSNIRLTVDYVEDLIVVKKIISQIKNKADYSLENVIKIINKDKEIMKLNSIYKRNTGSRNSENQKLWERAKTIIPGGNMLISKRPELFLPLGWPTYFKKAKGIKIWSEKKIYQDFCSMGVGTNLLGYGNSRVNEAVKKIIKNGNMSTLNAEEDIRLAEKLLQIHDWADMAKFARSGGEANAIAIRIARAASRKDKVAICGYHGWHDWYLAANLTSKKNLNNHLIKNLNPHGVPSNLKNTVFTFEYNNISSLKKVISDHDIGIIKMEVKREEDPKNNFLQEVRKIADKKNIILIFDECTSGFRKTFGGLHKYYKVKPDMAMFGKALGNGYAITAVIGKRSIMESASSNFISSTMWTERIGTSAAIECLNVMENMKSWQKISQTGIWLKEQWKKLAKLHKLKIEIQGLDAIPNFIFKSQNHNSYKTLITQELLKKNLLATNKIFISVLHNKKNLQNYLNEMDKVFSLISRIENGDKIENYLKYPESFNPYI
jgi:glutamate-1-semialdehyde aminotransferase/spore coat polysaccharide biosynthesis protein SpsF (cytidylyltransferase family)